MYVRVNICSQQIITNQKQLRLTKLRIGNIGAVPLRSLSIHFPLALDTIVMIRDLFCLCRVVLILLIALMIEYCNFFNNVDDNVSNIFIPKILSIMFCILVGIKVLSKSKNIIVKAVQILLMF